MLSCCGGCFSVKLKDAGRDQREKASTPSPLKALLQKLGQERFWLEPALSPLSHHISWVRVLLWIALGAAELPVNPGTNSKHVFVSKPALKTSREGKYTREGSKREGFG